MKICGQAETLFRPIRTRLFLHEVSYAHTMNFIGLVRSASFSSLLVGFQIFQVRGIFKVFDERCLSCGVLLLRLIKFGRLLDLLGPPTRFAF